MKHIAQESLAEFVRQTLPATETALVKRHIAECHGCSYLVGLYEAVVRVGANEAAYEPGDGVVRTVKAYFRTEQLRSSKSASKLLFDSLTHPVAMGARASVASARQLLYRVGTLFVDMRVDSEFNSERAALVGQMLDSANPGHPVGGVPIILLDGRKSVASTISNSNGEFHLEFLIKSNLRLSVTVGETAPVYLPITGVENRKRQAMPNRGPN